MQGLPAAAEALERRQHGVIESLVYGCPGQAFSGVDGHQGPPAPRTFRLAGEAAAGRYRRGEDPYGRGLQRGVPEARDHQHAGGSSEGEGAGANECMVEILSYLRETKPLKEKTNLNQRHVEKLALLNLRNSPLT